MKRVAFPTRRNTRKRYHYMSQKEDVGTKDSDTLILPNLNDKLRFH